MRRPPSSREEAVVSVDIKADAPAEILPVAVYPREGELELIPPPLDARVAEPVPGRDGVQGGLGRVEEPVERNVAGRIGAVRGGPDPNRHHPTSRLFATGHRRTKSKKVLRDASLPASRRARPAGRPAQLAHDPIST